MCEKKNCLQKKNFNIMYFFKKKLKFPNKVKILNFKNSKKNIFQNFFFLLHFENSKNIKIYTQILYKKKTHNIQIYI